MPCTPPPTLHNHRLQDRPSMAQSAQRIALLHTLSATVTNQKAGGNQTRPLAAVLAHLTHSQSQAGMMPPCPHSHRVPAGCSNVSTNLPKHNHMLLAPQTNTNAGASKYIQCVTPIIYTGSRRCHHQPSSKLCHDASTRPHQNALPAGTTLCSKHKHLQQARSECTT
jgi:hypothetical protein